MSQQFVDPIGRLRCHASPPPETFNATTGEPARPSGMGVDLGQDFRPSSAQRLHKALML
jgi:hypothetical protein